MDAIRLPTLSASPAPPIGRKVSFTSTGVTLRLAVTLVFATFALMLASRSMGIGSDTPVGMGAGLARGAHASAVYPPG